MQISIIEESLVKDDKSGNLSKISQVIDINNLNDFSTIALQTHICCGIFKDNIRRLVNFEYINFLQYDFDNGTSPEEVIKIFRRYNKVILASKNHMLDKNDGKGIIPRFHLFLQLDSPVTDYEFYSFIIKRIADDEKIAIDRRSVDATRYFYKHSDILHVMTARENIISKNYKPFYDDYNRKKDLEDDERLKYLENSNKKYSITSDQRYKAAKQLVQTKVKASISGNGGNNNTFNVACYGVKCGLNDAALKDLLNWYNDNYCFPKWSKSGIDNKIKYAKKIVKYSDHFTPPYIFKIIGIECAN